MKNQIADILATTDQLPEIEKTILRMFFLEEKTLDEIAQILQLRRERVRQLKQKALRRIELIKH
jgi:RNA polymerase sigma factor for flagellar operon FliA